MRELAKSTAGQELLAAGRATAINEMLASILQTIDLAPMLALNKSVSAGILGKGKLDGGRIAGLDKILETIRLTNPATAEIAQIATNLFPPGGASIISMPQPEIQALANMRYSAVQGALAQFRTPAARAAIEVEQSPAVVAAQTRPASKEGRSASKATQAQPPTDETEEKARLGRASIAME